jgi:hypothetical protein
MTYCTGGTITEAGGKRIHTFLANSTNRTNYILNPGFENNVTDDWTATGCTPDRNAQEVSKGNYCMRIIAGAGTAYAQANTGVSVPNGGTVYASGYLRSVTTTTTQQVKISIYDVTNATLRVSSTTELTGGVTERKVIYWTNTTGSAVTVTVRLYNNWGDSATAARFDCILLELATADDGFFDGDSGLGEKWSGAYHNSVSTKGYTPLVCVHAGTYDYLFVGGGGGGAGSQSTSADQGGGGGAGGLIANSNTFIKGTTYPISVGGGGPGRIYIGVSLSIGCAGSSSGWLADTMFVNGGGGGGQKSNGQTLACGGGAGNHNSAARYGGTGLVGYNGGDCAGTYATYRGGAGGGGMGSVGANRGENYNGGNGGNGVSNSLSGSAVTYAAGGGGGGVSSGGGSAGAGGSSGIGGAAGVPAGGNGNDGTANRGAGGGAAGGGASYVGGRGSDGIVIISYTPTYGSGAVSWMFFRRLEKFYEELKLGLRSKEELLYRYRDLEGLVSI